MWSESDAEQKIHLTNIPSICMKKEYGGMDIPNIQDLNICLIGSWIKRYTLGDVILCKKVIDAKYNTRSPNVLCCHDPHPSQYWKQVMWARKAVNSFGICTARKIR